MILGQCVCKWDGNSYYSPAFPRGAENATFVAQITHTHDSPTFVITTQHRDSEATAWTDTTAFTPITTTGTYTLDVSALKELVRFKYTFTSADAVDGVRLIMHAPVWRD